jgi:hypothetical protein
MSGLASGILVALIGFYATSIYDEHSKEAERADRQRNVVAIELQTVEKFFPHLESKDQTEREAAIQAISTLGNPNLAAKMAQVFGGSGARAALAKIASATTLQGPSSVSYALTDLYKDFGGATGIVQISCVDPATGAKEQRQGTISILTKDGFALTASHLFKKDCDCDNAAISVFIGSKTASKRTAALVKSGLGVGFSSHQAVGWRVSTTQYQCRSCTRRSSCYGTRVSRRSRPHRCGRHSRVCKWPSGSHRY